MTCIKSKLVVTCSISIAVIGLLLGGYNLSTKAFMKMKEPDIVSEDIYRIQNEEDDALLQIVKKEEIDTINGLNEVVGILNDGELLVQIGSTKEDIEKGYTEYKRSNNKARELEFLRSIEGSLYRLNINTLNTAPFKILEEDINLKDYSVSLSPDGRKLYYSPLKLTFRNNSYEIQNASSWIYDIINEVRVSVPMSNCISPTWTENSNNLLGLSVSSGYENASIKRWDLKDKNEREIIVRDIEKNILPSGIFQMYSKTANRIFFTGVTVDDEHMDLWREIEAISPKKNEKVEKKLMEQRLAKIKQYNIRIQQKYKSGESKRGVYSLDLEKNTINPIMYISNKNLSDDEPYSFTCYRLDVINEGKTLIMGAMINKENGLFVYNTESKQMKNLVESPSSSILTYKISPNERKILYALQTKSKNEVNVSVYVANITDGELDNKVLLADDIEFKALPGLFWSENSKKIVIHEAETFEVDNRVFKEKGVLHVITLK